MSILNPLQFYLCIIKPEVAWTAVVSSTPDDPYIAIPFSGGATGTAGMAVEGNTLQIGSTAGASDIGEVRIKAVTGTATGHAYVAETDDVGPLIVSGTHLTALREWRLWPKVPRQDATDPDNIIYYEDYDVAYTDQLSAWRPMAVAGPPAVAYLENGSAQVDFVGDRSHTLAPSATISSQTWTAPGSNQVTSSSLGTEGTPVSFTYTAAGQYTVTLEITDSNGNTATNHTWVYIIDPENPTNVITNFDESSDTFDRAQGGGTANFTVRGNVTAADFPRNALIIHASRGDLITATGTWPFRANVQFVGFVNGSTVSQDPFQSTVTFQAASITGLMKNLALYPARLESTAAPANWTQSSNMTVARILSYLAHHRSTLSLMAPIIELTYSALIKAQDFGFDSLYGQANKLLQDAWGQLIANHQGILYPEIPYQVMLDGERSGVTTGKGLNKTLWVGAADIQERPDWQMPVRKVKMSGVSWDGSTATPLFSEAPGDVQDDWGNERAKDSLILSSQADLNTRCGREFGRHHTKYPAIRLNFINEGTFQIAPQRLYTITTEGGDNNRGLALSASTLISRIRRDFDHINGLVKASIEFVTTEDGIAGSTVIMPVQAPTLTNEGTSTPGGGYTPPPPFDWGTEEAEPEQTLMLANLTLGAYVSQDSGDNWDQRMSGFTGTTTYYIQSDPWISGNGVNNNGFYMAGDGQIACTEDGGQIWTDLTDSPTDPPNTYSDATPPTTRTTTFTQVSANDYSENAVYFSNTFYASVAAKWRSWILKRNNALAWTWYDSLALDDGLDPDQQGITWTVNVNPDNESYANNDSVTSLTNAGTGPNASGGTSPTYKTGVQNGRNAVFFDSSSSEYLSFGTGLGKPSEFTVIMAMSWGFIGSSGGDKQAAFASNNTGPSASTSWMHISNDGGSRLQYQFGDGTSYSDGVTGGFIISQDTWVIIACRYTNGDTDVDYWTNTTARSINVVFSSGANSISGTAFETALGRRGAYTGGQYFDGHIGRMYVVDDALSDSLILGIATFLANYYDISIPVDGESRPLGQDIDRHAGENLYRTMWFGEAINLVRRSTADMVVQQQKNLGDATLTQLNNRDKFARVYCPPSDIGNSSYVYVFGYWNDGTNDRHVMLSTDGGATLSDIGNTATWGTSNWVSAFFLTDANNLFAFVAGAAPALWKSEDAGSSWSQLSVLPFTVKAASLSSDGYIVISNENTGSQQVAISNLTFTSWTDITGSLPTTGTGSIVWK